MRAKEFEKSKRNPIVYVDMDGVLADFFKLFYATPYNGDISTITSDIFATLPKCRNADALIDLIVKKYGSYRICSSPLTGDYEGSRTNKIKWIHENLDTQPERIEITHNKPQFARQADGTPNILIDDLRRNVNAWEAAGGIGIKYQANENDLNVVVHGLSREPDPIMESLNNLSHHRENMLEMFKKFLPLAMHYIKLKSLPIMKFEMHIHDEYQPTFGKYENNEDTLYVALMNRNPNDILRTVAHELVHYKQDTEHRLPSNAGRTGSPQENQANAIAGIVMRHFNKKYPEYLNSMPITENFADGKGPGRPGDSQRHGIPKKATMDQLQKAAKSKGRKGQLARWQINMRRGKKK